MKNVGYEIAPLSWDRCEELRKSHPCLVIPLGAASKEHGWHLPLNTDQLLAEAGARDLMQRWPVLVLPTLTYGYYPAFTEYPGSVSLRFETFRNTLEEIVRSWWSHGWRHFYVLNTGLSTLKALQSLKEQFLQEKIIFDYLTWDFEQDMQEEIEQERGSHADEMETSLMLHLHPELVSMRRAVPELHPDLGGARGLTRDSETHEGVFSPSGAWGDPTRASAKKGQRAWYLLTKRLDRDMERMLRVG